MRAEIKPQVEVGLVSDSERHQIRGESVKGSLPKQVQEDNDRDTLIDLSLDLIEASL
jgi:hypothetical protein